MEKAKAAISDFVHKTGKHDTTVHESVAPAVQHETVKPHVHEETTTAVDRERHQDHYHHTVQPVHDREVLPEKHEARIGEVQHREFDNRDHEGTKRALATEHGAFRDQSTVADTTQSQSVAPTVGGEHVHHHIHETIQPVVKKETIQPSVVHTTVPIHEVHHNPAKHHATSELPPVNMADFKGRGGVLGGREERYDAFQGEPKNIGGALKELERGGQSQSHGHHADGTTHGVTGNTHSGGLTGNTHNSGLTGNTQSGGLTGGSNTHTTHSTGLNQHNTHEHDPSYTGAGGNTHNPAKPSLTQRLNPAVDADGDGKKGIMD